jgi:hypothetical protein
MRLMSSLLVRTFASPCLGRKLKARVVTNFATLVNSDSQTHNNALEECFFQSLDIRLTSIGWSIPHKALDIIMILKKKNYKPKIFT